MVETRVSPDFADQAVRLAGTKRALASAAMMDLRMQLAAQRDRRALDDFGRFALARPVRVAALLENRPDPLVLAAVAGDRAMRNLAGLSGRGTEGEKLKFATTLEGLAAKDGSGSPGAMQVRSGRRAPSGGAVGETAPALPQRVPRRGPPGDGGDLRHGVHRRAGSVAGSPAADDTAAGMVPDGGDGEGPECAARPRESAGRIARRHGDAGAMERAPGSPAPGSGPPPDPFRRPRRRRARRAARTPFAGARSPRQAVDASPPRGEHAQGARGDAVVPGARRLEPAPRGHAHQDADRSGPGGRGHRSEGGRGAGLGAARARSRQPREALRAAGRGAIASAWSTPATPGRPRTASGC